MMSYAPLPDAELSLRLGVESPLTATETERLRDLLLANPHRRVLLDFHAAVEIRSEELGYLAELLNESACTSRQIALCQVRESIAQLMRLVGIEHLVTAIAVTATAPLELRDAIRHLREGDNREAAASIETAWLELITTRIESKAINEQLEHAAKVGSLGEMAGGVAHEFNNLIGIMSGYAEIALASLQNSQQVKESLEVILETSERASTVTQALLSFSRRRSPAKSVVDLSEIIRTQTRLLASECLAHRVELELEFIGELTAYVNGNLLEQVFFNLLSNALHAMPKGGKILIQAVCHDETIIIQVRDTGSGINKKDISRIFTPFFTTKGALGGGNVKGTGLGLSVSYGIVTSHKGTITVESEPGKGTTFTVTLPRGRKSLLTSTPKDEAGATVVTTQTDRQLTVLIADDEAQIRNLLKTLVRGENHIPILATDGQEAIRICQETYPDALLLDVLMPGLNGVDALLEIRRLHPNLPVAVITGQAGKPLESMLATMRQTGNIDLIRKPFKGEEIRAFLTKCLADEL